MTAGIRPAGPGDAAFLFALYRSTCEQEFAFLPPAQLEPLLRRQFDSRASSYAAEFPGAEDWVILSDAEPVGRLLWAEREGELRVLDIAILTPHQNRGLGAYALRLAIQHAADLSKPLRLSVRQANPAAARLYRRLGFLAVREDLLYLEMELLPDSGSVPASRSRHP